MKRLMRWGWPSGFEVAQFPNPPLIVALLASAASHLSHGTGHRLTQAIFYVALSVWAYEEARSGDNWFRRLLGLGFAAYILASLTQALKS
jgi:hypothetical protein